MSWSDSECWDRGPDPRPPGNSQVTLGFLTNTGMGPPRPRGCCLMKCSKKDASHCDGVSCWAFDWVWSHTFGDIWVVSYYCE